MMSFQPYFVPDAAAFVVLGAAWLSRHRLAQWRRTRWMGRPPRTGAFYASPAKLAMKFMLPFALFACALAVWCVLTPWLVHVSRYVAGLCALFGIIPAFMGLSGWASPGKLAARHLHFLGGVPLLKLDEGGFQYLSFSRVQWKDVYQIQYIPREKAGSRAGPILAIQMMDAGQPLRPGQPVDLWAHEKYTREVCRWVDVVNAGQWLLLDTRLVAGAGAEQFAYWMMALRHIALQRKAPDQPPHLRD
jgi:hypothetical protein